MAAMNLVWLPSLPDSSTKEANAPLINVDDDDIVSIKVEAQRALLEALSGSTERQTPVTNAVSRPLRSITSRARSQKTTEEEPNTTRRAESTLQDRITSTECVLHGSACSEALPRPPSSAESSLVPQEQYHSTPQASVDLLPQPLLAPSQNNTEVPERAGNSSHALGLDGSNTTTDGPYFHSTPVPGTRPRKNIYYDAPVANQQWSHDDFIDRCDLIVPELKKAIDSHRGLHHRSGDFRFMLRMVGTSPETATPSIIIFCLNKDLKALRKLFGKRNAARLYCHVDSQLCSFFEDLRLITRRSETNPPLQTPRPPFTLVFYPTDHPQLLRYSGCEEIKAYAASETTLCGALVQCGMKTASIGLSLSIEAELGLLTVDHLFGGVPRTDGESEECDFAQTVDSDQVTLNDDDYVSLNQLWIVDDDADDLPAGDLHRTTTSDTVGSMTLHSSQADEEVELNKPYQQSPYCGKRVNGHVQLSVNEPYLDAAIVKLDSDIMSSRRVNIIYPGGRASLGISLTKIAERPREHGARVFMASGVSGLTTGRLLKGFNYSESKPGQQMCKTWTVILDAPLGVIPGDCGSIIVDQETHEVYGHVVGADVVGHAHVVPLVHSIQQIKTMFDTNNVTLPMVALGEDGTASTSSMGTLKEEHVDPLREHPKKDSAIALIETDDGDAVSDFQGFVKDNLRTAWDFPISEPPDHEPRCYVDYNFLREYLNPERILKLLETTCPSDSISRRFFARQWPCNRVTDIYDKYLRVFAILVMIGQPGAMEDFLDHHISDEVLPLVDEPPGLYNTSPLGDPDLFEVFSREQWKFCPVLFKPGDFHRTLHPRAVLPFSFGQTIWTCNDTVAHIAAHKVTIDAAYSPFHHRTERTADHEPSGGTSHTMVLKTFHESDEDRYWQEVAAYHSLSDQAVTGLVRCIGSFEQSGRFTILLEHSDVDLSDFFERTPPPVDYREIVGFWNNLLRLVDGLHIIHGLKADVAYNRKYIGAHHNIKPANILVFYPSDESENKSLFKLADFSCSFADSRALTAPSDPCSAQQLNHRSDVLTAQQIDIWSLGCVFLVYIEWICGNYDKDQGETKIPRNMDADARSCLAVLADKIAPDDYVTLEMFPIVKAMLDLDPRRRPNALRVREWSVEALRNVEKRYQLSWLPRSPYLPFTVADVQAWKPARKRHHRKPKDSSISNLRSTIEERDQIFLVDDSLTMQKHWDDVKAIAETVAYLVKSLDLDGIDLSFTSSPETIRSHHPTPLVQAFEKRRSPDAGCGRTALAAVSEVLEERIADLLQTDVGKRKSLSLIILTDGVWGSNAAEGKRLSDAIGSLEQLDLPPNQVCLQFIRFGDDEEGKHRLDYLDKELCKLLPEQETPDSQPTDFGFPTSFNHLQPSRLNVCSITVQPWNGDVYEMLLPWSMTSPSFLAWFQQRFRIGWNAAWRRWRKNIAKASHVSCFGVS